MAKLFKPVVYKNGTLTQIEYRLRDIETPTEFQKGIIQSPEDIYEKMKFLFKGLLQEQFVVFCLNSTNKLMSAEIVTIGTLNSSLIHPREVFIRAIINGSAAIIIAHNHPSGNPEPSQEDILITKQIVEAGKIIGIAVHDHIIFTDDKFVSFADRELL
jgi:DNA repair protein RadC